MQTHFKDEGKKLSKDEFQKILQEIIIHTGFTGFGSKDILIYLYGIPAAALFIKQRIAPKAIPNDVFIPGITSASVFLLAKLNKIWSCVPLAFINSNCSFLFLICKNLHYYFYYILNSFSAHFLWIGYLYIYHLEELCIYSSILGSKIYYKKLLK